MPFVRKHGNQVAIVHGERDASGAVQQRVLFSFYSKPEAEAAIGLRQAEPALSLPRLLECRYEGLRFDWEKLSGGIAALKDELPEHYEYPRVGVGDTLRSGLVAATKGLLAADPQSLDSAVEALRQHRTELLLVRQLIDDRLFLLEKARPSQYSRDNEFGWRSRLAGAGVPPEVYERLEGMENRGERERVEAFAKLLVEAWPNFADGYNTLGRMSLERGDYEAALAWFQRALEIGRTLFPKRIAKSRWWSDLETRPYIRAIQNTALTLSWSGRHAEVLPWCDRLQNECVDAEHAAVYRAPALLNLGRWAEARDAVARLSEIWPDQDFVAAFASFEMGEHEDAMARWLHAAIQYPRTAWMLAGAATLDNAEGFGEVQDHNAGVYLRRSLGAYGRRKAPARFFSAIMSSPEVSELLRDFAATVRAWEAARGSEDRTAYDRMTEMKTGRFARAKAAALRHLLGC